MESRILKLILCKIFKKWIHLGVKSKMTFTLVWGVTVPWQQAKDKRFQKLSTCTWTPCTKIFPHNILVLIKI